MRFRTFAWIIAAWPFAASGEVDEPSEVERSLEVLASDPGTRDLGGAVDLDENTEGETRVHTVVKGDTLWDISEQHLGSPWQWPRVWSYNPEIENPHWIFPDDRVRLGPQQVPVATEAEPIYWEEEEEEEPDVAVVGKIGYDAGPKRQVQTTGIITPRALKESGTITKSWEEKSLLSHGDRVYLDWPEKRQVQVGNSYVIFRTERRIHHPTTQEFMGYFTKILGTVKIVDASPWRDFVTGVIERSFEEIERGDRIGPAIVDFSRSVASRPNEKNLVGRIAATLDGGMEELGQDHIVFIDRGAAHGVQVGNSLQVLRAGDGLDIEEESHLIGPTNLPAEAVGELLVVEVQETTAAALIVRALREMSVGDRVVMRAASR